MRAVNLLLLVCAFAALTQPVLAQPPLPQPKIAGVRTLATVSDKTALARGSAFEVTGEGLGPAEGETGSVPYPQSLGGATLRIGGSDAFLIYASSTQLVGIVPSALPAGAAYPVSATFGGRTSNSVAVSVVESNFGLLTDTGRFGGLASGRVAGQTFTIASPIPAGGAVLELDATGLGPIAGVEGNDFPPDSNLYPEAILTIGSLDLPVAYLGPNPLRPGFDRIAVTLPSDNLPSGCAVPARIRNGDTASLTFTLPLLAADQTSCVHPLGLSPEALSAIASGGSIVRGGLSLDRVVGESLAGGRVFESNTDSFSGGFVRFSAESIAEQTAQTLISAAYDSNGCVIFDAVDGQPGTYLDAGEKIQVTDPSWNYTVTRGVGQSLNQYNVLLDNGLTIPGLSTPKLRFNPGRHTLTGNGGADVGPFSVELNISPQMRWTNMAAITEVNTAADLIIEFTGAGPNDRIAASGAVRGPAPEDPTRIVTRVWTCLARGNAGRITAASTMLAKLPRVSAAELANPNSGRFSSLSLGQDNPAELGQFKAPLAAGGETDVVVFRFNYTYSKTPLPVR
jgi:uncharacterized protein (TIGR03437 family)